MSAPLLSPATIIFLALVVLTIVLGVNEFSSYSSLKAMNAAYKMTSVGDSWGEVQSSFGRPPHITCKFGEYRIHYYIDPTRESMSPDAASSLTYSNEIARSKADIPFSDGAKQYLIKDGVVIARVWCGEESYVETIDGPIKATSMRDLPDEFFDRVTDP